ncbi:hypothetical protein, partial [Sutterella wadsworthensis]|uniref:hypothetical protein n=1 Tax=Sutterella wadsworthensis TaxID=40545 RepID=UPI0032C0BCDA
NIYLYKLKGGQHFLIRDIRDTNNNFINSKNKIFKILHVYENITERNTKYHTLYSEKEKKDLLFNIKMYYILSDILYVFSASYAIITNSELFFSHFLIVPFIVAFFIAWLVFQILDYKSISYGSVENLIKYLEDVDYSEYARYNEINLPKEILPDWITNTDEIYTKESFDVVLKKLNDKKIKEFINKYRKKAFKSNKIISNNKKRLNAWLKSEKNQLVSLGVIPVTLFDYKSHWRELGYTEDEINVMYEDKIKELKGK